MYIYQIEVSNVCSLRCGYCPHPRQRRPKGYMSPATFAKCLDLFEMCDNQNTLRLHNFGEVLLHPRLCDLVRMAAARSIEVSFFTNGVAPDGKPFARAYWQDLVDAGLRTVDFSAHRLRTPEFERITSGLVQIGRVFDPRLRQLGTWAGQTGRPEVPVPEPCLFERDTALVVLWDGRISSCCLDVEGTRSELWVDDVLRDRGYRFEPIPLCQGCASMRHQESL